MARDTYRVDYFPPIALLREGRVEKTDRCSCPAALFQLDGCMVFRKQHGIKQIHTHWVKSDGNDTPWHKEAVIFVAFTAHCIQRQCEL